MATFIL